jgi:hypothetical protein
MRSLEFMIFQFLVAVILPNNPVGTSDLPAVGAQRIVVAKGCHSVQSFKGKPAFEVDRCRPKCPWLAAPNLLASRPNSGRSVLQSSRRLQI